MMILTVEEIIFSHQIWAKYFVCNSVIWCLQGKQNYIGSESQMENIFPQKTLHSLPPSPPLLNGGFFIANVTVKFLFTTHYCKQYEPNRAPEHRIKVLREFLEGWYPLVEM